MISKLFIENYRSIQKAELPLGKINVLTGANNSGKSSVLYAALTLKSLVNNPNRSLDAILTLPFINLGGFEQIVFFKNKEESIKIGCETSSHESLIPVEYHSKFGIKSSQLIFWGGYPSPKLFELNIEFPYPANKTVSVHDDIGDGGILATTWNGFTAETRILTPPRTGKVTDIERNDRCINESIGQINKIDFTPNQRGFTQAFFGSVPLQSQITTEEEIATLIATDRDLESAIAFYLEKIVDKSFQVRFTIGTANFYLQTRDKKTGFTTDLVNEGSGINQLVTILAKTLKKGSDFICIDEPEIHLHPSYIAKLAEVMVEVAENEGKQFLISTHSEHLVSSLLNLLVSKKLTPEDLKVFYCSKPKKETQIELQQVNEKGQIEGGFKSFIDAELENTKNFFKIR